MTKKLSSESTYSIPPKDYSTFASKLPNFEEAPPFRVNPEAVKNYVKNRGSLNIGDWAIEGRRMSTTLTTNQESNVQQPKVLGEDALRNYTKSRCSTPNLIYGSTHSTEPQIGLRVTREGRANYERNNNNDMKTLFQNYGKSELPPQPAPNTQGELATTLFYTHQEGQMGSLLHDYGRASATPRPMSCVKGADAKINQQKGLGDSQLLYHGIKTNEPIPEPHVKGDQASLNYDLGQGRYVNELFHQYGKLEQTPRNAPKVKFGGVENMLKGQGDSMRKTLSQCPPTTRNAERPPSVSLWS